MTAAPTRTASWTGLLLFGALAACGADPIAAGPPATAAPSPPAPPTNTTNQPTVGMPAVGPKEVLFVVGNSTDVNATDEDLYDFFDHLGFFATIADDDDDPVTVGRSFGLVMITSSVDAATVGEKYARLGTPVVVMQAQVFGAMGMTAPNDPSFGTMPGTDVTIRDAGHPLARRFEGRIAVTRPDTAINFGVPGGDAAFVASLPDSPDRAALFAYQAGAMMPVSKAPHRRVGFLTAEVNQLEPNGRALLEAAILWAWSEQVP